MPDTATTPEPATSTTPSRNVLAVRGLARRMALLATGMAAVLGTAIVVGLLIVTSVGEGPLPGDFELLAAAQAARTPWLDQRVQQLSAPGAYVVLVPIAVVAVATLLLARYRSAAAMVIAAGTGAMLSEAVVKPVVARPRPFQWSSGAIKAVEHAREFRSFPSGHAAGSAAVLCAIAVAAGRVLRRRGPAAGRFLLGAAITAAGVIGATRVWLGVHNPSDVLAGWALGAAMVVLAARAFPPDPDDEAGGPAAPSRDGRTDRPDDVAPVAGDRVA